MTGQVEAQPAPQDASRARMKMGDECGNDWQI
jgi:hypothetical protein